MTPAEKVKRIRLSLGMTMSEFAEAIDDKAKSGAVSNWESGKNKPNKKRLQRIAELGNTTVTEILHEKDRWSILRNFVEESLPKHPADDEFEAGWMDALSTVLKTMNRLEEE